MIRSLVESPVMTWRPTAKQLLVLGLLTAACSPDSPNEPEPAQEVRPSILLVTLDTTRADVIESQRLATPSLDRLAERGLRYVQAYTTAPMTLPAHTSMLTGLYPSDHGIRENARYLGDDKVLLASRLKEKGYATAAFVSGLPLSSQFGLARGFDSYDDDFADTSAERDAGETTDRALDYLTSTDAGPLFLWVHYFDPHEPYQPPEPFRSEYSGDPYLGEIAYMDGELGRLVDAFENRSPDAFKILTVGDHGEGLGDHGEALHGNLLYQGVMRVPLVVAGSGIAAGTRTEPVSVRRVFDTVLAWAGFERSHSLMKHSLLDGEPETVMGEAMKPFLQYGWQPQVMAVRGSVKVIRSGGVEVYDVVADPAESRNLTGQQIGPELRQALDAYPFLPASDVGGDGDLSQEDRERLASLGYADWQGQARLREGAPSPKDMAPLFADLDAGSGHFVREQYEEAIVVFERVATVDPGNLMVHLRLAVAHSVSGREEPAMAFFDKAREIAPDSVDVDHYLGMHYCGSRRWDEAEPLFERVLARWPRKLPALGCMGDLHMSRGHTLEALAAFERARDLAPDDFSKHLELGVLYLADRQLAAARDSLDRVPPTHPGYAMALFKRAQVSVLMDEPDREDRIRLAYEKADPTTRRLIENERLFAGVLR